MRCVLKCRDVVYLEQHTCMQCYVIGCSLSSRGLLVLLELKEHVGHLDLRYCISPCHLSYPSYLCSGLWTPPPSTSFNHCCICCVGCSWGQGWAWSKGRGWQCGRFWSSWRTWVACKCWCLCQTTEFKTPLFLPSLSGKSWVSWQCWNTWNFWSTCKY